MTDVPREDPLPTALHAVTRAFALGEVYDRRFLAHGLMNRNWRVDTASGPYAVKEITDVPLPEVRRNLAVLADLAGDGLPVPAPVATVSGDLVAEFDGHGYCVLAWVDGRHVPGTELTLDQARELGVLLASTTRCAVMPPARSRIGPHRPRPPARPRPTAPPKP
ncbi:phosphotransferase [Streptomyces virginiae]